ncbi:hydroxymethylglutaryl-CoA lyase [Owenweeksia hongkongensis]|uniref:hydroxymethylglutaryl-CoA lyase n=1 Tax=Owenweeksia hongkongensis TaxID=253245 RepID=UPI003A930CC5
MQGIHEFIPTSQKIDYINSILRVGFDTIDFGSFVSPKAIPQLKDTVEVLNGLELDKTTSKLLAIVANQRGAEEAVQFDEITYLGYPFSISEVFQKRNTNKSIAESEALVGELINICAKQNKELMVYISMGFGNPYDEPWNVEIVEKWSCRLADMGVKILSLSDTIGTSNPDSISYLFSNLIPALPNVEFGAHLHTTPDSWYEKVKSAYDNGCRRFDGAIKGFGGCPMAADDLVGNMPMEKLLSFAQENKVAGNVNMLAFESAYNKALQTFPM